MQVKYGSMKDRGKRAAAHNPFRIYFFPLDTMFLFFYRDSLVLKMYSAQRSRVKWRQKEGVFFCIIYRFPSDTQ
jgi:hypothetical protein